MYKGISMMITLNYKYSMSHTVCDILYTQMKRILVYYRLFIAMSCHWQGNFLWLRQSRDFYLTWSEIRYQMHIFRIHHITYIVHTICSYNMAESKIFTKNPSHVELVEKQMHNLDFWEVLWYLVLKYYKILNGIL